MSRALRVIDGHGEVADDVTAVPTEVAALVDEIVDLRRKLAAAKGQLTKLRKVDPDAETIIDVLEHWRVACNHQRAEIPLDGKRAEAVGRMLKLFTAEQLKQACDGVGAFPYERYGEHFCEPGPNRKRRDDVPYIFANEVRVERLMALGRADNGHVAYARWLAGVCREYPRVKGLLAFLASEGEPHGEVIVRAARWAREQTV